MRKVTRSRKRSQSKVIHGCLLAVRSLPPERLRLPDDTRKWQSVARARGDCLFFLSSFCNGDGTFTRQSPDGELINYSPSETTIQKKGYALRSFYRRTNELRDLGLLSWLRRDHHDRRTYRIHVENFHWSPKQIAAFYTEQVVDSNDEHLPDSHRTPATVAGDITCQIRSISNKQK